jgi:hypothetical protein
MECLGLHNTPKSEVHLERLLTGPREGGRGGGGDGGKGEGGGGGGGEEEDEEEEEEEEEAAEAEEEIPTFPKSQCPCVQGKAVQGEYLFCWNV